jgi:NitT/TauT family transport system substrate-binding protein
MRRTRLLPTAAVVLAAAAALTGCQSSSAKTTADGTPSVKIMVGGIDKVIYLPAKLTEQLGYFKDAGVDVQLLSEPAGAQAENVLLAGQVQGVVGFYDHTIALQPQGKCLESVVQMSKAPGEVEVVATSKAATLTSFAAFGGKKLGVTSPGSSTDFLTRALAVRNGVKDSAYTTVKAGAGTTFISALKQGAIDAGMTTDPTVAKLVSSGAAKVLVDMRTEEGSKAALGGAYPSSSLYMDCAWVSRNAGTVQKLANAMVKTLAWMDSHSAEEIAAKMPADFKGDDAALYAKAVADTKPMFTSDGVMPSDGPSTVLKVLATFNPALKGMAD